MLQKLLVALLYFACAFVTAFSQQTPRNGLITGTNNLLKSTEARQYVFRHFSTVNGLASNIVNAVVEDRNGFIWFATINGLQRYDGNTFLNFKNEKGRRNTLPEDNITTAFVDKNGNLWIATIDNKVGIFDTKHFTYSEVEVKWVDDNPGYFIEKYFKETADGKLVLSVRKYGNFLYDSATRTFKFDTSLFEMPKGWKFNNWFQNSVDKKYWIACDSGLVMYDPATLHTNYREHNIDHNPLIKVFNDYKNVRGILVTGQKVLVRSLMGVEKTPVLSYYNVAAKALQVHDLSKEIFKGSFYEINGFTVDKSNRIWIYGRPFLFEFTGEKNPFNIIPNEYKDEQSIKFGLAFQMYEDSQHNIWICTDNGVFRFNPDAQLFNNYNLIRPDGTGAYEATTVGMMMQANNIFWVGCMSGGLYCYDDKIKPVAVPGAFKAKQDQYSVYYIYQHSKTGEVWLGLKNGVLAVYDPKTGISKELKPPVLESSTVKQIAEDKQGNLWFGTEDGTIVKWDYTIGKNDIEKGFAFYMKAGPVYKLLVDKQGYLWVASMGAGIYKIDPQRYVVAHFMKTNIPDESLTTNFPRDILQYDDTTLLIANNSIDVINTRTNKISHITTSEGLPSNSVVCMQKDARGIVWMGMSNGLCRMNFRQKIFTTYDRRDGISFDNFNSAGAYAMPDGRLVFNNDHSFLVFNPDVIAETKAPADVKITDFRLGNTSLSVDSLQALEKVSLAYDNTTIDIDFSSLTYLNHAKVHYLYMMEGLDKQWQQIHNLSHATYTYLPPGTFTFKVKAENVDGINSPHITTLTIKVAPPFWRTWAFYGLIVLLAALVIYLIDKERLRRYEALQKMRAQIADNLYEDVQTTLSSINLLSEMAKIKADKDIDRSKDYIDQINDKSRTMITSMDDMLWSIAPENDSMEKTILRMTEFIEALKKQFSADIYMKVEDAVKKLSLDMKNRHEFFIIFKETVKAIVQFAGGRNTIINIDLYKNKLLLKLKDPTTCADENLGDMNSCIQKIKSRAKFINAETDIQSDRNGTSIIVLMPLT